MFGFTMFRSAGATGHVFTKSGGTSHNKGLGWSGMVGPTTVISVIPTTTQLIPFYTDAYGNDRLLLRITGNIQVALDPAIVQNTFDFTVNRATGSYDEEWSSDLQAIINEQVLNPIRRSAESMDVETAVKSQAVFAEDLQKALSESTALTSKGINVTASSISTVEAVNVDVGKAIGAAEREKLLTGADAATHERRIKAAENARAVQEYEAATKLKLEEANEALIKKQGENRIEIARSEAKATEFRLEPITGLTPGMAIAAAFMTAAEKGSLDKISLTTDLLTYLRDQTESQEG